MNEVTLSKGSVSVKVQFSPFSIQILKNNNPIIRRLSSEYDVEYKGSRRSFNPEIVRNEESLLLLKDRKIGVQCKLELTEGLLEVSWISDKILESVKDVWISIHGGEWYGQGELRFQVFPLSNHFISGTPFALKGEEFLARRIQAPFWINSYGYGILVDSYELFEAQFLGMGLMIKALSTKDFTYHVIIGKNIADCQRRFLKRVGLPRKMPNKRILAEPIFSTWAYLKKDIDQDKVLEFAREIKEHDFPCSVIEIDDKWEKDYGDHKFDFDKFPDPKGMVNEIHKMGYLVTLWVHPFINYESKNYEYAKSKGYLILDPDGKEPAKVRWWNGEGGILDISNPEAKEWFNNDLKSLKREYGINGFKFDDGDATFFPIKKDGRVIKLGKTYGNLKPNQYTDEWIRFVAENHYDLAEVRVGFLAQKYGVITREGDKESIWGLNSGLKAAIAQALTLSITGYPYIMPDMIGGNEYRFKCSKELFIRWVEATVLMPIVQYSIPPWRYDEETVEISKNYTLLHVSLAKYYVQLAEKAMKDGEPIVCPLVLRNPEDDKCTSINDEYLIGNLLVAPILEEGREEREVYLPKGVWKDFWSCKEIKGPVRVSVEAPLDKLPLYAEAHDRALLAMLEEAKKCFQ